MNRLKTTDNGGFPLELDDLRWQEEAVRDAFKGLTSFLERDNIILSGVVISGMGTANTTWTEGYVLINGEVCKVDASATPLNTVNQVFSTYIEVVVEYDPNGLETFENNVAYDTYEKRKATITTYATAQPGKTHIIGFHRAKDIINEFILNYEHEFTACQAWAQGSDAAAYTGNRLLSINTSEGNAYNINIDHADTVISGITAPFTNGMWLALRFTGNTFSTIRIGDDNDEFKTPGGKTYLYKTGEVAVFVQFNGKLYLTNPLRESETWHVVGTSGEPAFQNGWAQSGSGGGQPIPIVAFRNENGIVELKGKVYNPSYTTAEKTVFTLPFTIPHKRVFPVISADGGQNVYNAVIYPNGNVDIEHSTITGLVWAYLDSVTFRI